MTTLPHRPMILEAFNCATAAEVGPQIAFHLPQGYAFAAYGPPPASNPWNLTLNMFHEIVETIDYKNRNYV